MSIDSAAFAAAFPLRTWRLELTAEADADLGRVPSGIVRSALGPALLEAVCHLPEPACDTCPERKDCAWPNAFRPLPRAGRYQNPPVPYILSWRGTGDLRAGHQARLHLTLIGEAQRYAEDWLEALRRALGRGEGDVLVVEKTLEAVCRSVGLGGDFGAAAEVDASQHEGASP